ncbi:MAG TPA: hypothetical protein VEJ89_11895 [Myxococcaceae bacterium]|jgi:hypothetical protein|nr:hypothetical protein [Myxococcaceae bacterium]
MRPFPLARLALPALLALAGGGCFPTYPPPVVGYPGNIYLSWTFAGASCAQTPSVSTVTVTIPNDPVPVVPNVFPCAAGNPPSTLAIYNFNPGSYVVNLTAQDSGGTVIFTGSATVVVNGDAYATITLTPVGGGSPAVYLSWGFDTPVGTSYPPCTDLTSTDPDRMDSVAVYVDGASTAAQAYDCNAGTGTAQVTLPALTPGNHTLQLVAYQDGLPDAFAQTDPVQVTVAASGPTSQTLTFHWLVGGVGVAWTYPSSSACTTGGVASVTVTFAGQGGYASAGNACATPVVPFKRLPAPSAGGASYALGVAALGATGTTPVYSGSVPSVTIRPGVFYDGTSATLVTVPLN